MWVLVCGFFLVCSRWCVLVCWFLLCAGHSNSHLLRKYLASDHPLQPVCQTIAPHCLWACSRGAHSSCHDPSDALLVLTACCLEWSLKLPRDAPIIFLSRLRPGRGGGRANPKASKTLFKRQVNPPNFQKLFEHLVRFGQPFKNCF